MIRGFDRIERLSAVYHGSLPSRLRYAPVRTLLTTFLKRTSARPRRFRAKTFWGREMIVYLPEEVSQYIYRFGLFEPDLTRALCALLRPGDVFFDIGAHFGYFSLLAAELVGSTGAVHAFEPARFTYRILGENLQAIPNARCVQAAIWNTESELYLTDYGVELCAFNSLRGQKTGRPVDASARYAVQAIRMDDYVAGSGVAPSVVKVDAENAEYEVVEGMRSTMERHRPVVTLEVGDHAASGRQRASREAVELAQSFGYRAMEFRGAFVPHQLRERYEYDNLFMMPVERAAELAQRAPR